MGTRVELHLFALAGRDVKTTLAAARRVIEAVDDALTIHRPSPTTALNEALLAGHSAAIDDPLLFDALVAVDDGHAATAGLFDTVADRRTGGHWSMVTLDRATRRMSAARPLALDFGGVGKGIALDRAAAALRADGIASALLSAGESSIMALGAHPLGGGWPFAIPHPLDEGATLIEVELIDEALSISATIGATVTAPERASTLRPGGNEPVTAPRLTLAIAASGTAAEMASTALIAADPMRARRLLDTVPGKRHLFDFAGTSGTPAVADSSPVTEYCA